jgi:hypothetical protein
MRATDGAPAATGRTARLSACAAPLPTARRCADRQRTGSPHEPLSACIATLVERLANARSSAASADNGVVFMRRLTLELSGRHRRRRTPRSAQTPPAGGCPLERRVRRCRHRAAHKQLPAAETTVQTKSDATLWTCICSSLPEPACRERAALQCVNDNAACWLVRGFA